MVMNPDLIHRFRHNRTKEETIQALRNFIVSSFKDQTKYYHSGLVTKEEIISWLSEATGYKICNSISGYIAVGNEKILSLFPEAVLETARDVANLDIIEQFYKYKVYLYSENSLRFEILYLEDENLLPQALKQISEENISNILNNLEKVISRLNQLSDEYSKYKKEKFEELSEAPRHLFKKDNADRCLDLELYAKALLDFKVKYKEFFEHIEEDLKKKEAAKLEEQTRKKNIKSFWIVFFVAFVLFLVWSFLFYCL